jgi:hypothetical protein
MRLFKRGGATKSKVARFEPPAGTLQCMENGCPNHTAVQCAYVDRRRRSCNAAFCPQHWSVVGGIVYCRRHAGTIAAIGLADPLGMPDLENRAPSLVNWVARDLDGYIRESLQSSALEGQKLVEEKGVKITYDRTRTRRFERCWKLVEHTGVIMQVTLFVSEDDDATVHVRIGAGVVAEGVPPWIERRRRHLVVSDDVDKAQREMFYEFLREHIGRGLAAAQAMDQRYR